MTVLDTGFDCASKVNIVILQNLLKKKKLRRKTRLAKLHYKNKVEEKFTTGNAREAWQGLNTMMGRAQNPALIQCSDPATFAEQLNIYYSRFDMPHPQNDWTLISSNCPTITVDKRKVASILGRINPHKASGPDRLRGKVLRECSVQLGDVITQLLQHLLDSSCVPRMKKEFTLILVPKKSNAREMKDFRPVALTSILCKCMERVVSDHLTAMVVDRLDPLQFAYKAKRGVEDACLTLLDTVCRHLDSPNPHTRILFMDFSFAFNTVNTATLCNRLLDLQVNPTLSCG